MDLICPNCGLVIYEVGHDLWVHATPQDPDRPDVCFADDDSYSAHPDTEGCD